MVIKRTGEPREGKRETSKNERRQRIEKYDRGELDAIKEDV